VPTTKASTTTPFWAATSPWASTAYAEDLVINFEDEDGDGAPRPRDGRRPGLRDLTFTNLTTQDKVTITVNGVKYTLQVGVDLDGNIVAN
jgi:hypothetical protein